MNHAVYVPRPFTLWGWRIRDKALNIRVYLRSSAADCFSRIIPIYARVGQSDADCRPTGLTVTCLQPLDMLIPELYSSSLAVQPQTAGSALRAWTTGQVLEATVVRQALDGTVTLRVGSQEVQARTGLNLAADQALPLQVAQSGTQTVLRVLHVSNAGATPHPTMLAQASGPTPETTLTQAWRQVLPREGDLRPAARATGGWQWRPARTQGAARVVAAALKQFAARLPLLDTLTTPAGLKRAVGDSGIFLEAHLAQALTEGKAPAVQNDIKANLLQLVAQLRSLAASATPATAASAHGAEPPIDPALPVVLRQADAALARIEQNQLATLSGSPQAATLLAMDLPVRDARYTGVLELGIEEQESGTPTGDTVMPWACGCISISSISARRTRVTLRDEEVAATLWAEHEPRPRSSSSIWPRRWCVWHAGLVPRCTARPAHRRTPVNCRPRAPC